MYTGGRVDVFDRVVRAGLPLVDTEVAPKPAELFEEEVADARYPPPVAADGGRGFTARQGFGSGAVRPDDLGELLRLAR
ncbi:hypothetical protein ACWD04_23890 [Streptomyces sp. NPDC002911]